MLIGFLTERPDEFAALADGLRAAGHAVRFLPPDACEETLGNDLPTALIVDGTESAPHIQRFAEADPQCCILALLTLDDLAGFSPEGPFTDFAVAPYRAVELAVRLALHQCRQRADESEVIQSGSNYTVSVHDERIELTFKEYELLKFLVSHPGRVFTREALLEQVWGYDYWGGSRTIDVHIRRIRSKLPVATAARIETVHQVGYRYATPRG
jgi:DNA-binding response OmpR family regulator